MTTEKFDPTKPVQTRGGKPARIVCTTVKGEYPIIAIITPPNGNEYAQTYTPDGSVLAECKDNSNDLVNIPEKKFVNIWERDGLYHVSPKSYTTAEGARKEVAMRRTVKYVAIAVEVEV